MILPFEELKFLIIDKQRKREINKLFHLYVKCESYSDILKLIKSEGNIKWIFNNGFRDLIPLFPIEELEAENFYQREVTLSNQNSDIFILFGGSLNLTQSEKNRCRVIIDGSSASITVNDMAMVEIEMYRRGSVSINSNGWSYTYIVARNSSIIDIYQNDNSTSYLEAYDTSNATANLKPNTYIYNTISDSATLTINKVTDIYD